MNDRFSVTRAPSGVGINGVAEIYRRAGISQATYFNWKRQYQKLAPLEIRRLKQIKDENTKLRTLVADLTLDREILQAIDRRRI
ncbi:putative transposase [Ancylobacter rudongensis]|uniref:Putative transposase n=1 Tax=Ancylobacter rudongensis TaxID=177413 RepID=A0A1G4RQB9_9HYPH|nr:putative transposase [Ancylobacter rudongensis]